MIENLVVLLVMLAGLAMIPFGLPGLWLMIGVVGYGVLIGEVAWWIFAILLLAGIAAEVLEFLVVKVLSDRHGGSRGAWWGAIAGGIVGAIAGGVIPIVGSVIGVIVGTFAGAAAVTMYQQRELAPAMRVGFGAMLGRIAAIGIKITVAVFVLVVGMTAFIIVPNGPLR